jgi:MoaA/NifB/PqqE/SkfB family radical SAM enzyme
MCTTCYEAPELTREQILDLVDQAAAWGVRVFNPLGGEPFVRSDLEEILAHAAHRNLHTTLTTNGTLIHRGRAERIAAVPPEKLHINVSIDGLESAHDQIRGSGMFRRTLEGYRRLREADRLAKNPRRKICGIRCRYLKRNDALCGRVNDAGNIHDNVCLDLIKHK